MQSDSKLPSVAGIVAGEPIRGSWWAHKEGRKIWEVLGEFSSLPYVLDSKLVSGKVTFVHKSIWPDFLAICLSGEEWQTRGISKEASLLLGKIKGGVEVDTSELRKNLGSKAAVAARELELRMLAHARQYHTAAGFHAKKVQSWKSWADHAGISGRLPTVRASKDRLEAIVHGLNERYDARAKLPWE